MDINTLDVRNAMELMKLLELQDAVNNLISMNRKNSSIISAIRSSPVKETQKRLGSDLSESQIEVAGNIIDVAEMLDDVFAGNQDFAIITRYQCSNDDFEEAVKYVESRVTAEPVANEQIENETTEFIGYVGPVISTDNVAAVFVPQGTLVTDEDLWHDPYGDDGTQSVYYFEDNYSEEDGEFVEEIAADQTGDMYAQIYTVSNNDLPFVQQQ